MAQTNCRYFASQTLHRMNASVLEGLSWIWGSGWQPPSRLDFLPPAA
jgi:hypothetical protein